jgi:hypothetical protein
MIHVRRAALAAVAIALSGCGALQKVGQDTKSFAKTLRPESWDAENPADDPGDPWIEAAGLEGRSEQTRENDMDPLRLRTLLMSPRARSIERNVGIDD